MGFIEVKQHVPNICREYIDLTLSLFTFWPSGRECVLPRAAKWTRPQGSKHSPQNTNNTLISPPFGAFRVPHFDIHTLGGK